MAAPPEPLRWQRCTGRPGADSPNVAERPTAVGGTAGSQGAVYESQRSLATRCRVARTRRLISNFERPGFAPLLQRSSRPIQHGYASRSTEYRLSRGPFFTLVILPNAAVCFLEQFPICMQLVLEEGLAQSLAQAVIELFQILCRCLIGRQFRDGGFRRAIPRYPQGSCQHSGSRCRGQTSPGACRETYRALPLARSRRSLP